jgi:hypothetical protein
MILEVLQRALGDIRKELAGFEPERISTSDAGRVFDVFIDLEKTISGGKTLVAGRAADSGRWRTEGHRSPASWVAETTGTGLGEAFGMLQTSEKLGGLPETAEAVRRGELSGAQLKAIVATAAEDPSNEGELLEAAGRRSLAGLKDECRRVKARSESEKDSRARYEQIRRTRSLRMWIEEDGAGRIEARLAPDDMARFSTAIRRESNAIFAEARKAGHREPTIAYEADALVALVTRTNATGGRADSGGPTPTGSSPRGSDRSTTTMHLRVDLAALRRGRVEKGEVCEIPGVGPVPLATAVNTLGEAILRVVITDGVDVRTICHLGRAVPARIRSALEERDERCVVPGCDVTRGLEIDHYKIAFEHDGPTELWNLARVCRWHHYLKTYCRYELTGDPGSWEWRAPSSEDNPILTS